MRLESKEKGDTKMIYKIRTDGQKVVTAWRGDCFRKAVAEARRENRRDEFLGIDKRWIGVYQDNTSTFAAIGIERNALSQLLELK
jgi:hypothetical protein